MLFRSKGRAFRLRHQGTYAQYADEPKYLSPSALKKVESLLKQGVDANAPLSEQKYPFTTSSRGYNKTPFGVALNNRDWKLLELLIANGATWDGSKEGRSELRDFMDNFAEDKYSKDKESEYQDSLKALQKMLALGVKPNEVYGDSGWTPLHYASEKGSREAIDILLAAGANVNTPGRSDKRNSNLGSNKGLDTPEALPLVAAAFWGKEKTVTYLMSKGTDLQYRSPKGYTALDFIDDHRKRWQKDSDFSKFIPAWKNIDTMLLEAGCKYSKRRQGKQKARGAPPG